MPAQKRSHDSSPPPPPQPMEVDVELEEEEEEEEEEEKDGDSHQLNQNGEQADESDDSDGSSSSSDEETEDDKDEAKPEFITLKLSDIRKEVQCPICLGVIRKTRTVMECLHRFCRECIDKSMRLGNNECPACRTHCASRRSLRDDPNYDNIIAYLYPDIDKYEEEELAFHDEEKARNKQIQASIAQTLRRQSEALGRKRSVRATATAFVRRSHNNYRNTRGRRNHRNIDNTGSEEEDDANANDGGKDSSSADEQCQDVKRKRYRRWSGTRISQPSGAANANANAGCDDNDLEVNRELLGVSAGLVGSSDIPAWGRGGMRSHTRHGPPAGANGKFTRNNRISKLMDCLRCSDENSHELDVSLMLVSLYANEVPSLQRPYLCCKPTLSIGQLCQYVSLQTSMSANEVQIWAVKGSERSSNSIQEIESVTPTANLDKSEVHPLEESHTLGEIHNNFSFNQGNLVLAYGQKNKVIKR